MTPVEIECCHGCASNSRRAYHEQAVLAPVEMIVPTLSAGIVKADGPAALRIGCVDVSTLPLVALAARPPQIRALCGPASYNRYDMLNAQRTAGYTFIRAAVAATVSSVG